MRLYEQLPQEWRRFLELEPEFFKDLEEKIDFNNINPKFQDIFKAFELSPEKVKVVLLGQDPYPNEKDAMGMAFSVNAHLTKIPKSLQNIKRELNSDLGIEISKSGDLTPWQMEGVLLLNSILTTEPGKSAAHAGFGWELFTTEIIKKLAERNVIFLLWGNYAQNFAKFVAENRKVIGVHPSPLSAYRGFFGSKPFSAVNEKLKDLDLYPSFLRLLNQVLKTAFQKDCMYFVQTL